MNPSFYWYQPRYYVLESFVEEILLDDSFVQCLVCFHIGLILISSPYVRSQLMSKLPIVWSASVSTVWMIKVKLQWWLDQVWFSEVIWK